MWWLACGRYDLEARRAAFWLAAFGKPPDAARVTALHPLRSLEVPPAAADLGRAKGELAWAAVFDALDGYKRPPA